MARDVLKMVLEADITSHLVDGLRKPDGKVINASEAVVPLLAAVLFRSLGGPMVVATGAPGEAARVASDLECFLGGEAFHMPGGAAAGDWFRPYDEAVGRRLKATRALRSGAIVVAGVEALVGGLPGELPEPWPLVIREGEEIDLEATLNLLVEGGYEREYTVEGWGRFAVRGGILDIFASTAERPVRIELSGDTVESLREFNIVTQRSGDHLQRAEIFPAAETGQQGRQGKVPSGTRVVAVNPGLIEARAAEFCADVGMEPPAGPILAEWGTLISVDTLGRPPDDAAVIDFPGEPVREFRGDLNAAAGVWKKFAGSGDDVRLLLEGKGQVERARELWDEQGSRARAPRMGIGTLSRGFAIPPLRLVLFTSTDLLGRKARRRAARRVSSGTPVTSYAELKVDGHVVHVDQGIGIYRGLVSREALGVMREYLLVEYAGGDRLYVPTSQLPKVQRYVGAENPTVHRLRGKEWSRASRRARRSAEKTARDLLMLYMEMKTKPGFAFSQDTPWQAELEDSFEYDLTPDQARAVAEVKADMESSTPMDRLICGDVGYGKTEVAVRATMKAAMDSKQVVVLVPTTVLASQHFETFRSRLGPFPVRVEMLSRFLDRGMQDRIIEGLRSGEVDVVIGTHRLLQDDVFLKDLGLMVVDEEQRFGVEQKERLRRLKRNVDTLTLSATPIPRTLQMSMSGVRDISVIDTPPEDRHPVATYVGEFDPDLVGRAVNYEVARGGQVFYVHNRIESINRVAKSLAARLPEVSIEVAHGRMHEDDLERVMLEFADGLHGVLVCTTIIESGLDLPNVNTLITDRADRLGLAQLYQIRGRVGRSAKKAYAYLFYPHRAALTDTATARLATISEMTPLGSGMRVAMRDLEIRGAGNLLGAEQSGQIEAVGFEFYCQLLRESVELLTGEATARARQATIELPVDAYIPEEYVSDQQARVEIYRRAVATGEIKAIEELSVDLEDRFGDIPEPAGRMLELEKMKIYAGEAGIEAVTVRGEEMQLKPFAGEEGILEEISKFAVRSEFCDAQGAYIDGATKTLYLKLRLRNVNKRQELLLKWLKLIIDDRISG